MAIFSASLSAIARSDGRSAAAAAAYRAACVIVDPRTGEIHDYRRKGGVLFTDLILPGGQSPDRAEFWSSVELHHKRKDAVTARELLTALPAELPPHAQISLALEIGAALSREYGVAVDVCVHAPSLDGDERNVHAHILTTACTVSEDGTFGKKCEAMDPIHCKRNGLPTAAEFIRPLWERLVNQALADVGIDTRIDHRSHKARGLDEVPGSHHGPAVTEILRTGRDSDVADRIASEAAAILSRQLLDAQASAELLEAQAAQALADLAAELELERVQSAEVEAERQAQALVAELANALADALDREEALLAEAERQADQERQRQAQAAAEELAEAHKAHAAAVLKLEKAVQVESRAEVEVEFHRLARDQAIAEQREAGKSLLKTAQAAFKVPSWNRAVDAYELALAALKRASAAVQRARDSVAKTWARVLQLDPTERQRQADALAVRIEASAEADRKRQSERFTTGDKPRRKSSTNANEPPASESSQRDRDRERE